MAVPVYVSGQVLLATDCNNWFLPVVAYRSSDQSVTSSTTFVNDNALVVPVAASAAYVFDMYLNYEGGTAGASDLKFQWTFPSGLGMRYRSSYLNNSGNLAGFATNIQSDIIVARTNGASTLMGFGGGGMVTTSSTAGNLQLQWAQNTSSGTATIMHGDSYIRLQRVG